MTKHTPTRRTSLAIAAGLMAAIACTNGIAPAAAQSLQKVRLGVATTVLGISYPWLMMPQALGYWKEEGYDVDVVPIGGSLQVVQQMVGGGIDIGQINASVLVQSRAVNDIPLRAFMANGVIDWSIAVGKNSPVQKITDLKGKKIGVFNLASGGIPFLKSYLSANGIDPESDVELIPVGLGASAVQALRGDKVDALMFWASANASFENAGLELRYIADPTWRSYPDFSMVALQGSIAKDTKMLEAIARGAAKATVFAFANPDCVRQIQWKKWPDTKPTGADDAILAKWDVNSLSAQLQSMKAAQDMNTAHRIGETDAAAFGRLQDFMKKTGLVAKTVPPADLVIAAPGFSERVNTFDHDAIIESAKACKLP